MQKQTFNFLPVSVAGQWSVGLIVCMPILFFVGSFLANSLYQDIPAGNTIAEDLASRPALALSMLTGMVAGVLSFAFGLLAVLWKKDYSMLVFLAATIGATLLIFLAGELLFPH